MNIDMNCNCNKSFQTISEYPCSHPGCIRPKSKPDCVAKAVIPLITVDSTDGITSLADCFVHIATTNTTYYIDDKHRIAIIWAGPVEAEEYDISENPYKLRSQTLYTTVDGEFTEIYYDRQGLPHTMAKEA